MPVAREQAAIQAQREGKPLPPHASRFPPRPALDPANFPPLLPLDFDPPEEKHKKKRDLRGPKVIMEPPPEPRYLVQGLFAASSLNLLVGDPCHKKSILAIDLALSVAMGKPRLGQAVGPLSSFYPTPLPTVGGGYKPAFERSVGRELR